jgi:hypothetical protein
MPVVILCCGEGEHYNVGVGRKLFSSGNPLGRYGDLAKDVNRFINVFDIALDMLLLLPSHRPYPLAKTIRKKTCSMSS